EIASSRGSKRSKAWALISIAMREDEENPGALIQFVANQKITVRALLFEQIDSEAASDIRREILRDFNSGRVEQTTRFLVSSLNDEDANNRRQASDYLVADAAAHLDEIFKMPETDERTQAIKVIIEEADTDTIVKYVSTRKESAKTRYVFTYLLKREPSLSDENLLKVLPRFSKDYRAYILGQLPAERAREIRLQLIQNLNFYKTVDAGDLLVDALIDSDSEVQNRASQWFESNSVWDVHSAVASLAQSVPADKIERLITSLPYVGDNPQIRRIRAEWRAFFGYYILFKDQKLAFEELGYLKVGLTKSLFRSVFGTPTSKLRCQDLLNQSQ
ncbi:MAG: hypothetical protein AAF202_05910, partial [Pseudomonadota bacterium]